MRDLDSLSGHPGVKDVLWEIANLHSQKSADYGTDEDPLANLRATADFGVPPWVGTMLRENDKTVRVQSFLKKGNLKNESVEDSLKDKALYSLIALVLYREEGIGKLQFGR